MRQRRDLIILIALFVALVAFTLLGPGRSTDEGGDERPTTHSSRPGGAMGLLRWVDALGYDGQQLQYQTFTLDERAAALFILQPSETINRTQAAEVLRWVDAGGTLVLADDRPRVFAASNQLLDDLDLRVRIYEPADDSPDVIERAPVLQPALARPPLRSALARASTVITSERADLAPLLGPAEQPVLVGLARGKGYVYVSSTVYPFTNAGLRDEQNAALVLNLLRRVPAGGRVLFDEYHHGFFAPPSLRSLILGSPWGWALIYGLAVLAAYLLLTGRRFGRPVPLREDVALRSSAEYVESMADLLQRGGKRDYILRHYAMAFKRRLARPYGINPATDDAAFVSELARYRPGDQAAVSALLARLRQPQIGEEELLRVIADADAMVARPRT